jgi:hypothetical protein
VSKDSHVLTLGDTLDQLQMDGHGVDNGDNAARDSRVKAKKWHLKKLICSAYRQIYMSIEDKYRRQEEKAKILELPDSEGEKAKNYPSGYPFRKPGRKPGTFEHNSDYGHCINTGGTLKHTMNEIILFRRFRRFRI